MVSIIWVKIGSEEQERCGKRRVALFTGLMSRSGPVKACKDYRMPAGRSSASPTCRFSLSRILGLLSHLPYLQFRVSESISPISSYLRRCILETAKMASVSYKIFMSARRVQVCSVASNPFFEGSTLIESSFRFLVTA